MRFRIFLLGLAFSGFTATAQPEQVVTELINALTLELPEDYDVSELTSILEHYQKHPVNLNKADPQELKNLFFLSPVQIGNLREHIRINGPLLDLLELQGIDGFDTKTISRVSLFAIAAPLSVAPKVNFRHMLELGKHDIISTYSHVIEKRKGFTNLPGSRYLGTPFKAAFRYSYKFEDTFSIGLIMEKDAGETLLDKNNLPDFIAGNISFTGLGKLQKLVLGDYSLQFGQGLTLWSGFSFGKGADIAMLARKDIGLKPYASANEYSFLRGIAASFMFSDNVSITPFFSSRKVDGSLSSPDKDATLSAINETGLHRTATEIKNQSSLRQTIAGTTVKYEDNSASLGVTVYHTIFDHRFVPGGRIYQLFNFSGSSLTNAGVHYNYAFRNSYWFGEISTSISQEASIAWLNGVLLSLSPTISFSIFIRNYAKDFYNFFSNAIAEASGDKNETGLFAAITVTPNKYWNISFYADKFHFPWLKFRVDAPSNGFELMGQVVYTPTKQLKLSARLKTELKQENAQAGNHLNYLEDIGRINQRLNFAWTLNKKISIQTNVEMVSYSRGKFPAEFGWSIAQDLDWKFTRSGFSGNLRLAYFNTPSYNSRMYAYENDVLYGFSYGIYNGYGYRAFLNLKFTPFRKVDFWGRYAISFYPKNKTVGSGLDEITGNKKQDLKFQVRYQF